MLVPFVSYLILIGPLASGLSFRVNHMEEVFAALPAPIIFCIRIVNGMGPSWFLLQLFVLSLVLVLFRKADKKGRLSAWGERCSIPVLLAFYLPILGAARLLYIAYTFRIGLYLLLFLWDIMYFLMTESSGACKSTVFCCLRRGLQQVWRRRPFPGGSLIRLWLITGW